MEKIDKRTKAYKESVLESGEAAPVITNPEIGVEAVPPVADYEKAKLAKSPTTTAGAVPPKVDAGNGKMVDYFSLAANNLGFKLCTHCGCALPSNEDGSPRSSKHQGALCDPCIWRNNKK